MPTLALSEESEETELTHAQTRFLYNSHRLEEPEGIWPERPTGNLIGSIIKCVTKTAVEALRAQKSGNISPRERESMTTFLHHDKTPEKSDHRTQKIDLSKVQEGVIVMTTNINRSTHSALKPIPKIDRKRPHTILKTIGAILANIGKEIWQINSTIVETLTITPGGCALKVACPHEKVLAAHLNDEIRQFVALPERIGVVDEGQTTLDLPLPYVEFTSEDHRVLDTMLILFASRLSEAISQNQAAILQRATKKGALVNLPSIDEDAEE